MIATQDHTQVLVDLRRRLADLLNQKQDIDALLGDAALVDQADKAMREAARYYHDATLNFELGDIKGARRCRGQAENALVTASGCIRILAGEE